MFFVNVENLICKENGNVFYKLPVIETCFRKYWSQRQKDFALANQVSSVQFDDSGCYVTIKVTPNVNHSEAEKVAQSIIYACGDPRQLF